MRLLFILLLLPCVTFGQLMQETNTSQAVRRLVAKNYLLLPKVCGTPGTPDGLNYSANDGAVVADTCAGTVLLYYNGSWLTIASNGNYIVNQFASKEDKAFNIRSGRLDSLYASGSSGLHLLSNSGTVIADFGAGGGSQAVFRGFAGYNSNVAANYTARSFTDKNYVDSALAAGGSGTVTSVGLSMPSAFTVSGSPVTSSGTLAVTGAGTTSQYIRGDGSLATLPSSGVPGGSTYSIQYNRGAAFAGSTTFVFDSLNTRVGIGKSSPSTILDIESTSGAAGNVSMSIKNNTATGYGTIRMLSDSKIWQFGVAGSTASFNPDNFYIYNESTGGANAFHFRLDQEGRGYFNRRLTVSPQALLADSVGINGVPSNRLSVSGSANITGSLGIGAVTPATELEYRKSASATIGPNLMLTNSANAIGDQMQITFRSGTADRAYIRSTVGASPFHGSIEFYTGLTTPTEKMRIVSNTGNLLLNTTTDVASSLLTMVSTTKGFLRPVMTSTQRNAISSPAAGLSVYNTTDGTNDVRVGSAWYNQPNGLKGSAALNFGNTAAQTSADLTITITGAADGDHVILGVPNAAVNANTCYTAWVSAANTVTVRFNNYSAGAIDPASATFKVYVIKN